MSRIAIAHGTGPWIDAIEDFRVVQGLKKHGFAAEAVIWGGEMSGFDAVLVGSAWDYAERSAEFHSWLEATNQVATLLNPLETLKWSLRKTYLEDLQRAGVPCVPTVIQGSFDPHMVSKVAADHGWDELIIKSVVSAGGVQMVRIMADDLEGEANQVLTVVGTDQILVQPFVPDVAQHGEWSLVYFGGDFSHGVLKRAAEGEYRVQDDWGGTVHSIDIPDEVRVVADAALAACPHPHVYARVDVFAGEHAWLNELEMVEPELFYRFDESSIDRLADSLHRHLS